MLPLKAIESYDNYYRYLEIDTLDDVQIPTAKARFLAYRNKGTIRNEKFSDDIWTLTDEVRTGITHFDIDSEKYKNGAGKWIGIGIKRFQILMKTYFCLLLGEIALPHLVEVARQLRLLAYTDLNGFDEIKELSHCITFLKLLPGHGRLRDRAIEDLESMAQAVRWKKGEARRLLDFQSYLRFDKALKEYWTCAGKDDRKLYFPVYFWWNLTAVLPLRATEFLLTPADCIRKDGTRYIISIRRTVLKKQRKKVTYKIDTDYEVKHYEIPGWLGEEIIEYQKASGSSTAGMLLKPSPYAASDYLTYGQMAARLKKFLKEAVAMPDMDIHIGDTRHLAMINLVLSGGSPTICKELAGHEDIDISSNYYANLSTIIESTVYEYCHEGESGAAFGGSLHFPAKLPEDRIRLDDGWCCYPAVKYGEISECMKNYSRGKELGDCRFCSHYIPDQRGLQMKILKKRKNDVDRSCEYLIQMIDLVRHGNGCEEDIGAALAKLQNESFKYTSALVKKYREGR